MGKVLVGVDLGGSHITVAAVTPQAQIPVKQVELLDQNEDADRIIRKIIGAVRKVLRTGRGSGKHMPCIGVGVPGVVDITR